MQPKKTPWIHFRLHTQACPHICPYACRHECVHTTDTNTHPDTYTSHMESNRGRYSIDNLQHPMYRYTCTTAYMCIHKCPYHTHKRSLAIHLPFYLTYVLKNRLVDNKDSCTLSSWWWGSHRASLKPICSTYGQGPWVPNAKSLHNISIYGKGLLLPPSLILSLSRRQVIKVTKGTTPWRKEEEEQELKEDFTSAYQFGFSSEVLHNLVCDARWL